MSTTYYIYKNSAGAPVVLTEPAVVQMSPLELIEETTTDPKLRGDEDWVDGEWVQRNPVINNEHKDQRRLKYPYIGDQLDALWHAMERGDLPKVPEFYDPIEQVKLMHPKDE